MPKHYDKQNIYMKSGWISKVNKGMIACRIYIMENLVQRFYFSQGAMV